MHRIYQNHFFSSQYRHRFCMNWEQFSKIKKNHCIFNFPSGTNYHSLKVHVNGFNTHSNLKMYNKKKQCLLSAFFWLLNKRGWYGTGLSSSDLQTQSIKSYKHYTEWLLSGSLKPETAKNGMSMRASIFFCQYMI